MEEQLIIALTAVGITFLLISIVRSGRIYQLLRDNIYDAKLWLVIIMMLVGFIIGYLILILQAFASLQIPISLELVVALVYFFGSIFTIVTTRTVQNNLTNILGKRISKQEALTRFVTFTDLDTQNMVKLDQEYSIMCEHCEQEISYSIPKIVQSNVVALDRGISVEDIFGTKSYILRPSHKCIDGRREYTIVHDKDLEIRSIEGSRIIYGGDL